MISCVSRDRLQRVKRKDSFIRKVLLFQTRTLQHFSHSNDKRIVIPVLSFATLIQYFRLIRHVAETTSRITIKRRYRLDCCCHVFLPFRLFYAAKILTNIIPRHKKLKFFRLFIPSSASPPQNKPRPWPRKHSANQFIGFESVQTSRHSRIHEIS